MNLSLVANCHDQARLSKANLPRRKFPRIFPARPKDAPGSLARKATAAKSRRHETPGLARTSHRGQVRHGGYRMTGGVEGLDRSPGYAPRPSPSGSGTARRDDAPAHGEKSGLEALPSNDTRWPDPTQRSTAAIPDYCGRLWLWHTGEGPGGSHRETPGAREPASMPPVSGAPVSGRPRRMERRKGRDGR